MLRFYAVFRSFQRDVYGVLHSQATFTFIQDDWLQWTNAGTNLGLALPPNSQFAYSFGRLSTGAGWENMATMDSSPTVYGSPSSGDVALIPTGGGTNMNLGSSSTYVATFDLGLADAAGAPVADAPIFAPSSSVTSGTAVTVSAIAAGTPTLTYQWADRRRAAAAP